MATRGGIRTLAKALGPAIALTAACAHGAQPTAGAPAATRPEHHAVFLTGSRLPQLVADECRSNPGSTDNVRVYCRERLEQTGRDGDLGAALRALDPSVTVDR